MNRVAPDALVRGGRNRPPIEPFDVNRLQNENLARPFAHQQ